MRAGRRLWGRGTLYKQDNPYLKMTLKMVGLMCGWILEPSRKPRNPTSGGAPPNPQSDAPSLVQKRYFRQGRKLRPKYARDPPADPSVNPPGPVDSPGLFPCTVHLGPPGAYQAQPWRSTCQQGPSRGLPPRPVNRQYHDTTGHAHGLLCHGTARGRTPPSSSGRLQHRE